MARTRQSRGDGEYYGEMPSRRPRTHAVVVVAAFASVLILNHVLGRVERHYHTPDVDAAKVAPAERKPALLLIGSSYGRRGFHADVIDAVLFDGAARTGIWFCDATPPSTWRFVLRRDDVLTSDVRTVVLGVSPITVRGPGRFTELALRRMYRVRDVPALLARGFIADAAEVGVVGLFPAYRARNGIRQFAFDKWLRLIGRERTPEIGRPMDQHWKGWESDEHEMFALRDLVRRLKERGIALVVAEWPMSAHLDASVARAVADGFRPEMRELAAREDFTFIPLPDRETYLFEDEIHPEPAQGRRWSAWLAAELRERGLAP